MGARVVVLGSLNVDLVVRAARFPAPGETLLGHGFAEHAGGKGANQAVAAARLFAPQRPAVALIGRVGADERGERLRALLEREGVDARAVGVERETPTGVAAITVANGGENQIVVAPGANAALGAAEVEAAWALLAPADVALAQLEVPVEAVAALARACRRDGARFVLNAAPARELDSALLRSIDVLVVNALEASALSGIGPGDPAQAALELRARGPGAVAVTLGARGALWLDAAGLAECAAPSVQAVDATGAGDAFTGALAHALALHLEPPEALRRACAAGAWAASHPGAMPSLPTGRELEILLSTAHSAPRRSS
jgi:ribokinase